MLLGAVVAAGLLVIAGVVLAGPIPVGEPRWAVPAQPVWPTVPPQPAVNATLPPAGGSPVAGTVVRVLLTAVLAAAVALVAAFLVAIAIRRFRDRRRRVRADAKRPAAPAFGGAGEATIASPVVRRGIERAIEILDSPRPPDDAIVAAWLGLEEAARDAGAPRGVSETPAEHAARIISRFDTNGSATDILLRLYEDVRYGGRRADEVSVRTARECLVHVQRSWRDAAERQAATGPDEGGTA